MPWAPLLDAALVVVFAALGRASHAEENALVGALATAWPFLVGLGAGTALSFILVAATVLAVFLIGSRWLLARRSGHGA